MADCQNCRRLSQENQVLQVRIEKLESRLFWLRQTIEGARAYAHAVYIQATQIMGQHQSRGTWSYYKGRGGVAAELYNMLGAED